MILNEPKFGLHHFLVVCLLVSSCTHQLVQCQDLFGGVSRFFDGATSFADNVPLIGKCDRLVYRGVLNCMTNYSPVQIGTKGMCW